MGEKKQRGFSERQMQALVAAVDYPLLDSNVWAQDEEDEEDSDQEVHPPCRRSLMGDFNEVTNAAGQRRL